MAKKSKRQSKWVLLFRKVNGRAVYLYEPLKHYELKSRLRKGWKMIN